MGSLFATETNEINNYDNWNLQKTKTDKNEKILHWKDDPWEQNN